MVPAKAFLVPLHSTAATPGRRRFPRGWLTVVLSISFLIPSLRSQAGADPAPDATIANRVAPPPPWTDRDGFREATLSPRGEKPGFTLTNPGETGIRFVNAIPESRHLTNQILLNGSGIAAGDVDGDGWTDVFFAGFDGDCALFRNLGNWRFEDGTAAAGVALSGYDCTGAAMADLDGDSDLDLIVNTLAQGTLILHNDGRGKFRQTPPPLAPGRGAMTTAIGDFDGDGYLDLYVTQYRTLALMDMPNTRMTFRKTAGGTVVDTVQGRPASDPEFAGRFSVNAAGGIEEHGEPDVLFRNEKGARFVEVPWTQGAFLDASGKPLDAPPRDWGLAAMFRDVDHDGRPDLYVCNDFQSPDRLWLNRGEGRFQLAPALALRRTSLSSMAVDFADINRDGHDDFLVLEMLSRDHGLRMRWVRETFPHVPVVGRYDDRPQIEQNTLQLGRGNGTWSEIAQLAGLEATEWSWGCAFLDVDLDGWEDVLVVNGMERAGRDLDAAEALRANRQRNRLTDRQIFEARRVFPRLAPPNLAFRNQGDLTFRDASGDWGFQLPAVSQAIALADFDNDGDADVLVGNLNAPASVYRNDAPGPRIAVRLSGRPPNTRGIGARIEVVGGGRTLSQEMIAGGRYLSGDDPIRTFAAPASGNALIRVHWPGGGLSEIADVRPNTLVEIAEPAPGAPAIGRTRPSAPAPAPAPSPSPAGSGRIRFRDISPALSHRHHEEGFDDYARQPLLPRALSQPGPGLAWVDLDRDGDDDLVVGSGMNGRLAAFRNEGSGAFQPWPAQAVAKPLARDATAVVSLPSPTGPLVLAALSNVEDGAPLGPAVVGWETSRNTLVDLVPATDSSPGPMAHADIDGDGDLDMFVGGRVVPSRWPAPATSRFLKNEGGR
ncbi:MAG: CRTAC1 family protein, partial [Limisphaerales bacterium]